MRWRSNCFRGKRDRRIEWFWSFCGSYSKGIRYFNSEDLTDKADLIVSEVISNEFLIEGVLDTVEDAKKRLLAPGGRMIPESGHNDQLGRWRSYWKKYTGDVLGFNLEPSTK